jgi:hypothetical protein
LLEARDVEAEALRFFQSDEFAAEDYTVIHFVVREISGLLHWIQQGGNSNLILVLITACYVVLTYRMAKTARMQTEGALRPALRVVIDRGDHPYTGSVKLMSYGSQPAMILFISFEGSAGERRFPYGFDVTHGQLLAAGEPITLPFDFEHLFTEDVKGRADKGYSLIVCASDLSQTVRATYYHYWPSGSSYCRTGMPWKVKFAFLKSRINDLRFNPSVPEFIRRRLTAPRR